MRFGGHHRRVAIWALFWSVLYVGAALVVPFVLNMFLQGFTPESAKGPPPSQARSLLAVVTVFLLLGLGDAGSRLAFARFLLRSVGDLRSALTRGLADGRFPETLGLGDYVTRWTSDTARLKSNLFGFMVHSARNAFLIVSVSVLLAVVDPWLGAVFAVTGMVIAFVARSAAVKMRARAMRTRARESAAVDSMLRRWRTGGPDPSKTGYPSESEAGMASLEAGTVFAAHSAFAVGIGLACGLAVWRAGGGSEATRNLILAVSYGLLLRGSVVQLARHGARLGKASVLARRLRHALKLLALQSNKEIPENDSGFDCRNVVVFGSGRGGRKRLLQLEGLNLPPGSKVLVKGKTGAGKTTFLRLLAGVLDPSEGEVLLGGEDVDSWAGTHAWLGSMEADWPPDCLAALLKSTDTLSSPAWEELRTGSGLERLLYRLPRGESAVLASRELSSGERGAVALAAALGGNRRILLLDEPFRCWGKTKANHLLKLFLKCAEDRMVVVASSRNLDPTVFDRIVRLRNGKIDFSGTPRGFELHQKSLETEGSAPENGKAE